MRLLGDLFLAVFRFCYRVLGDYGAGIILFTFLSKLILFPVAVMVQINSIRMVKLYPELNRIKAKNYGNRDAISEAEVKLYKENRYHPTLDIVPVVLQLILLMGVVAAIRRPAELTPAGAPDMHFLGFDLGVIPWEARGVALLMPVLAAASSWFMCFTQNRSNVLQSEQSKANQYSTLILSVLLSLYLGLFVPAGVGFYWILGNLFSVAQMYLLNALIDPKRSIDYEALKESREELAQVRAVMEGKREKLSREEERREKADYRRFLAAGPKQIVFYSEKNGFYKYFRDVIEEILRVSDVVIHYITSDPNDAVFDLASERFHVYYIGEKRLIVLMMKMDADIVVLTTPDLQKYHIKRSMVRDDIEYVYMDHAVASANLTLRKHALDAFDTIFATGEHMAREIRETERVYSLPKKTIVKSGYALIDRMIADYDADAADREKSKTPEILIAPSWQDHNLMDEGLEEVLDALKGKGYHITVRPHPQYVRHCQARLSQLKERFAGENDIELQTDFSSNRTVFEADVLITDWSGIAYEYAFTTCRPVLFINTPMKVMNPDYREVDLVPFDIEARDRVGISVDTDRLDTVGEAVHRLLTEEIYTPESLKKIREEYLYHIGESGRTGAGYLLHRLIEIREASELAAAQQGKQVREEEVPAAGVSEKETEPEGFFRRTLRRAGVSALFLMLPAIMIGILAPLEIYAGNRGEFMFGTGDFLWMYLGVCAAACIGGGVVLGLLPQKLRGVLHTLILSVSVCAYIQNLFLNRQLSKTDGSKVDWSQYHTYGTLVTMIWFVLIIAIFVISYRLKQREKVQLAAVLFLSAIQLVASVSLFAKCPYRVKQDRMYVLDSTDEYRLAPGNNIIVLILDRYDNISFENMLDDAPEAAEIYKDFTFYSNANSRYNYTFPSVIHMLTHVEPDCTMRTDVYKEYAWKNGVSKQFHDTIAADGYTYRLYTGSGRAIYLNPAFMEGSIDNVKEIDGVRYTIHHDTMFYIMTKTSLLKYAPYPMKPYLEIQNFYFDGIVSYDDIKGCTDDNGDYYEELKEIGLSVDPSLENALIITHLTGAHNPYTIDEYANPVPMDTTTKREVCLGLNVILKEYFDQLKELGLYDSATILLTADHGEYIEYGQMQPIYLIKPAGQQSDHMQGSSAPIDSGDFLATMLELIGEDHSAYGTSIFDWKSGDERERSSAYPNDGFDVYTYTGTRGDLMDQVDRGIFTHMDATEDWE